MTETLTVARADGARLRAHDLALVATFAAMVAVTGLLPDIKTGLGVPYSAQTLAVMLAGAALGWWRGFLAVCLYLAGGAARVSGLPAAFQERTGLAVETLNPLQRMLPSSKFEHDQLDEMAPGLSVGVGLALRRTGIQ